MKNARLTALEALLRVDADEGYSNIVLDQSLKKSGLDSRDSALASTLFYGVLENRITLDWVIAHYSKLPLSKISLDVLEILRMAIYQLCFLDKIPQSAAVNEAVRLTRFRKKERASGFVNGLLRSFLRSGCKLCLPDREKEPRKYLSVRYSCPEWLIAMWTKAYGADHTLGLLQSFSGRPPLAARVNTTKVTDATLLEHLQRQGVQARLAESVPNALLLEGTGAVEALASFQNGEFHIQDLASQICCTALAPQPGQRVIDVCSAPGGKSFTLAEMMKNQGELYACDLYEAKVRLIREGAERLGLSIIQAKVRDAREQDQSLPLADRVLCDAPCSGLGIIRRKPEIRYKNSNLLDSLPDLQYFILCKSSCLVAENGILVYSTCTLNPKENGRIADKFLQDHPSFEPYPLSLPAGVTANPWEPANQLTLMPHLHGTDGFFISAFRRLR